jgi:hypothetical protein
MKLISTSLSLNIEPSIADVNKALLDIQNVKQYPIIILAHNKTNYLQTIYSKEGYVLEYKCGPAEERLRSKDNLNIDEISKAFKLYLQKNILWKDGIEFEKINITKPASFRIGYIAGSIAVKISKFFKHK